MKILRKTSSVGCLCRGRNLDELSVQSLQVRFYYGRRPSTAQEAEVVVADLPGGTHASGELIVASVPARQRRAYRFISRSH